MKKTANGSGKLFWALILAGVLCGTKGRADSGVAPAIYSLFPTSATNGSVLTLWGTNFNATAASNIVYFGAVQAAVTAASPTSLTVTVPAGASFGPVTVRVGGLTAYSQQLFLPTFLGCGSNITSATFPTSFDLSTSNTPVQTVIADFDGDGKPDLAVASMGTDTILIYRNLGTTGVLGTVSFAPPISLAFPTNGTSGQAFWLRGGFGRRWQTGHNCRRSRGQSCLGVSQPCHAGRFDGQFL